MLLVEFVLDHHTGEQHQPPNMSNSYLDRSTQIVQDDEKQLAKQTWPKKSKLREHKVIPFTSLILKLPADHENCRS